MLTVWFLFNIRVLRLIVRTTNTTIVSVSLNLKGRVHETIVHDQHSVFSVQFSPEYSNQRQSSREPWVESNVRTAGRNQTPQGSLTFFSNNEIGRLSCLVTAVELLGYITCNREQGLMPRSIVELQTSRGWRWPT